ncbi:hypothetical protein [Enterococcus mediterraneensis]|uniref:hypothetical protein n=1 Tax=Enterococcus mediterraneensis TaxID=2364791 RepID=UPI000F06AB2B|nr:hypothetical protein [Enterococcus mediterraneensis]
MIKKLFDRMITQQIKPKDEDIATGNLIENDGKTYFVSGKNVVCLTEHFPDTKATVTDLIESTIQYEGKSSEKAVN